MCQQLVKMLQIAGTILLKSMHSIATLEFSIAVDTLAGKE